MTISIRDRHILVIGVDGVRDDIRRRAHTPTLDAIAARGFETTTRVDDRNPTISGPVWSTLATGVYSDEHGVVDNDFSHYRRDRFPDFLARIRSHYDWATTFVAGAWGPIATSGLGGPIFAGGGYRPGLPEDSDEGEIPVIAAMDEAVTSFSARQLRFRDHAAAFVYLLTPDMVGHAEGVTPRYQEAIETADEQIAILLAAVAARPRRAEEEWTIIVTTDHGHRDGGHHGGDSPAERQAWLIAAGPGITAASAQGVDHADIGPHALARLDIPVEESWGLAGRDFAAR